MKIKRLFLQYYNVIKTGSMSMSIRLFVFLTILVFVMVLAVLLILLLTGRITQDYSAPQRFVEKEFAALLQSIQNNLGETDVQLVSLSQSLSRSIEFQLSEKQISVDKLPEHTEVLAEIIGNEVNRLQLIFERTKCSGAFLILDATVNPNLENAEYSKAGIYIRRFEPDVSGSPEVQYFYYRGFANIAHQNNLFMRATWDMEFNVKDSDFYNVTIGMSRQSDLPVSKLFYWSMESVIPELDEPTLLCSIPLVDSHGITFGVAGFEISEWNFSVNYAPDNLEYKNIIALFSRFNGSALNISNALVSGSLPALARMRGKEAFSVITTKGLYSYGLDDGSVYLGLHDKIKMYSSESPFANHNYVIAVVIPKDEIDAIRASINTRIVIICAALLVIGIGVSFLISRRYLKPITSALDEIKTGHITHKDKTKISEIDSLLEYIAELIEERKAPDKEGAKQKPAKAPPAAEEQTQTVMASENLKHAALFEELNFQELRVADMTLRGYSYTQIAQSMELKPNTVKWYQKILYSKLGISSKRELFELAARKS